MQHFAISSGNSERDDAWRCFGEAITAVETTKETWCEAGVNYTAGVYCAQVA